MLTQLLDRTFLTFGAATAGAKARVFCFAHAGGTSATFAPWSRSLAAHPGGSSIQIVGIELPGHGTRMQETLLNDVQSHARSIADALIARPGQTGEYPYAFYGHSLGAVIAFETARRLAEAGMAGPRHLFVGACRTPEMPAVQPLVGHLTQADFLVAVQTRYGGIPAAVLEEPELLEMVLPIMRADFAAYENYRYVPGTSLSCPISAFSGASDPVVRGEDMAGWANHTSGLFRQRSVPGDHFFLGESRDLVLDVISRSFRDENPEGSHPGHSKSFAFIPGHGQATREQLD